MCKLMKYFYAILFPIQATIKKKKNCYYCKYMRIFQTSYLIHEFILYVYVYIYIYIYIYVCVYVYFMLMLWFVLVLVFVVCLCLHDNTFSYSSHSCITTTIILLNKKIQCMLAMKMNVDN